MIVTLNILVCIYIYIYTVESRDYAPPLMHDKSGEGVIRGILTFPHDDRRMPRGRAISVLGCLMGKTREKLLTVATVFAGGGDLCARGRNRGILRYIHWITSAKRTREVRPFAGYTHKILYI